MVSLMTHGIRPQPTTRSGLTFLRMHMASTTIFKHQVTYIHNPQVQETMLIVAGVHSQHEIYEDLGLGAAAQLDPSFNVNNVADFDVLNLPANDPTRAMQFECTLSGTTAMYEHVRHLSSTQSSNSVPGLTGSTSASPTTTASRRASAMAMAPITEQSCTNIDLTKAIGDFHFPSWDQLPSEFQNPATSASFEPTIPLDATTSAIDVSASNAPASIMTWDDHELSFEMDMDMDLDFATEMTNAGMTQ